MKRIISIALILCSLKCISLYAQTIGMYYATENYNKYLGISASIGGLQGLSHLQISCDSIVQEAAPIPYNVPLEEIAEKIEYLYAYEKMLCETSASTQYEELEPLPEGRMRMTIYTAEGNKVLFLPEGTANTEVLINDEVCELYYSEEREGYLFYYINDFRTNEDGVPVNAVGNGDWEEWFGVCIMEGESQPNSDSRYYTYYPRFDFDDLNKIGEIEVNLDAQKRISLSDINVYENEYIESMIRTVQSTLAEKEKYGEYKMYLGTYGRMTSDYDVNSTVFKASGCVVGKDVEQYFFFTIYDCSSRGAIISYASSYYPPSEQEWESGKYYFSGDEWLPCANQEERIQKIKEMNRVEIPFTVTEREEYHEYTNAMSDEKEHEVAEKIDFDAMSDEEAINMISYLYSYSEWFGMNELGCPVGEVRGFEGKELIMYTYDYERESLYFIPAEMVNEIVICEDGRESPMYINENGYAEFYSISGNPAAIKTEQLKTTLWSKVKFGKASFENLSMIGRKTLEKHELSLLEVPKVERDEYVDALVDYIRDLLVQEEKYGEYKIFIGEYEAMDANRVCLSTAVCGEEEYYVRYLIIKSQKGKYYFWPVGFGLNGSLEECEADRHYMNAVCIERARQLERTEIVLDIEPSVSLLKLEEILENNLFENVTFQNSEKAIVFYETNVHTPFEGYQIPVYRETSEKNILFEGTFLVEKETGDIYIRGEKDWVLLKEGILKGLNLPDEPEDVFIHEYDGDNEVIVELLEKVFDFLKTKKEYANFKIKYDGAYSFLGRKYHSVSLIEDINDDMIHTLKRYSVDMETGDLYQESDSEERKELYYMGNLGTEQEAVEVGTEDIEYVDKVIPVQCTNDLSYLSDMKYTNSTYVYQDGKVYCRRYHKDSYEEAALWGEYDAIPETKKEMVCVDAEGIETVLFTDEGYGDIYLLNNRFYLTMAERKESIYGYTYTARCLYSVNMQGKERIDYGEGYVFAIDKDRKIIIMQLREESNICYYAVNYETGKKERLCFEYPFDSGAYQDGWFYYESHTGDDITCKLCAVSLEGEEREIIVLTSYGSQVPNVREHISDIKVDENRIYFVFGGCDGSLQVFQGGKLISIKLDGTDYKEVETENDVFYLSHDKGKSLVYFVSHYNAPLNENDTMVWDVEENICYRSDFPADALNYYEKSIYKDGSIYKNAERMWRYYPARWVLCTVLRDMTASYGNKKRTFMRYRMTPAESSGL